jgi:DNA-binding transcriptional ArsR family regulator
MTRRPVPGEKQATPIRDAAVLRALAHPARLALLEHLGHSGPATATECAGVVDLSPSAVSYHLRALAKVGLVEAAPGRGDGRERRWRRTAERYQVESVADVDPEVREATRALLESLLAWDETRARRYLAQVGDEPKAWQDAAFFMDTTLLVTATELSALSDAMDQLLGPYRKGSRADPPAGARAVSAAIRAFPA